jgi:hypothetical protein
MYTGIINRKEILDRLELAGGSYGYSNQNNKRLLHVYCNGSSNFQEVCQLLLSLNELFTLSVSNVQLKQNDMVNLSRNHNMKALSMIDCKYLPNGSILKNLSACKKLTHLGIATRNPKSHDSDAPIKWAHTVPQIFELEIIGCNISPEDLTSIKKLQHLATLNLTATHFTNEYECLAIIADCSSLESLSFKHCSFSTNYGLRMISKLNNIRLLDLFYCRVPEKIFDSFIDHPSLKKIIIFRTKLCEDDINLIKTRATRLPEIIEQQDNHKP